jgi:Protein of unknown function (DUF3105)
LLIAGGLVPVAVGAGLIAVAALVFAGRGKTARSDGEVSAAMQKAGCTLKRYPALDRGHFTDINERGKYNSFPPTTGPHYHAPVNWGAYTAPLVQTQVLHNLEHGGIAIQFGDRVPEDAIRLTYAFFRQDPDRLVVAPLPALHARIALTAWTVPDFDPGERPERGSGHLASCSHFDRTAFEAFVGAYRGRGPEQRQPSP